LAFQSLHTDACQPATLADEEIGKNDSVKSELDNNEVLAADALLVERCIQGEVAAWESLYRKCHTPLCTSIRIRLGRLGSDAQLVDELAARVWYLLVAKDGEQLTKYRMHRKSILTFIRLLARRVITDYFRTERRRMKNEFSSLIEKKHSEIVTHAETLPLLWTEFLALLTPRERQFCFEYLQVSPDDRRIEIDDRYSPANIWQLTRRIYKKFLSYIGPAG
jgi:DNA-directed RNA polymerase specialized sigma24 family protein